MVFENHYKALDCNSAQLNKYFIILVSYVLCVQCFLPVSLYFQVDKIVMLVVTHIDLLKSWWKYKDRFILRLCVTSVRDIGHHGSAQFPILCGY